MHINNIYNYIYLLAILFNLFVNNLNKKLLKKYQINIGTIYVLLVAKK